MHWKGAIMNSRHRLLRWSGFCIGCFTVVAFAPGQEGATPQPPPVEPAPAAPVAAAAAAPVAPAAAAPVVPAPAAPAATQPPPEPPAAPAVPSLDKILEDLAQVDPALLAERLAQSHAQIQKLKEENESLKAKISANEADVARLSLHVLLLDALVKVRGAVPAATNSPAPAATPTPPAAASPAPPAPPTHPSTPEASASPPASAALPMIAAPPASQPPPAAPAQSAMPSPSVTPGQSAPDYQTHVYPIFADNCLGCHNPDKAKGGLVLDSFQAVMQGGGSGAVIQPGNPDQSRLYRLIAHLETPTMPPMRSKVAEEKIDVIRRWIAAGAAADARAAMASPASAAPASPPAPALAAGEPGADADPDAAPMPAPLSQAAVKPAEQPPPASAIAVSPVAPLLAVGANGQVLLFHLDDGRLLGACEFGDARVQDLRFSHDGRQLLAAGGLAGKRGSAVLFEVETGRPVAEFGKQYDAVLTADLSADGTLVAVGGANRKVRVFDAFAGGMMHEIGEHNDWIEAVRFSPDGLYLATADRGGAMFLWESDTGRKVHELRGHLGAVHALAFQADSAVLASAGRDGTVRFWGVDGGNAIRQIAAHGGGAKLSGALDVSFAPDGRLATCGADGRVRLWRSDGGEIRSLESRADWAYRVAFSLDARRLVVGDWSGSVTIFDVETGATLTTLTTQPLLRHSLQNRIRETILGGLLG